MSMYEIQEHSQNINDRDWWRCGTQNVCGFFYVLVWNDPILPNKHIMKFGYKLAAISLKKNYAEPHNSLPVSSDLWIVKLNPDSKNKTLHRKNDNYLELFIRKKESQINRDFKNHNNFIRCHKSREYYDHFNYSFAINCIKNNLHKFNEKFEIYLEEKSKNSIKRTRRIARHNIRSYKDETLESH